MHLLQRIEVPLSLDTAGIDRAFIASHSRIFLGDMTRFAFSELAYDSPNLRNLPPLHLFDHRIRGPLIPPLGAGRHHSILSDEWASSVPAIEAWLGQMLEASDRLGAREVIARSLRLNPASDAAVLAQLGARRRDFYRHCIRGRLGVAIRVASNANFPDELRETALSLVAKLLVYFACFSIQIVAARAWWIDHLPFRRDDGPGPYRVAAFIKDLAAAATVVDEIGDYMAGKRPRYPNRAIVSEQKPLSARWRPHFDVTDDELRPQLNAFFEAIKPVARKLGKSLARARGIASDANKTMHRVVFGVSAGEALAFGATRLIQLRDHADELVRRRVAGETWVQLPTALSDLPGLYNRDVGELLYVLRIVTLADPTAGLEPRTKGNEPAEFAQPEVSLVERLGDYTGYGPPGEALIESARELYFRGPLYRDSLASKELIAGQLFDVLPEFFLFVPEMKVEPAPPVPRALSDRKKLVDEQNRRHRPPNRWLASGRDRSRKKRQRKD